MTISDDMVSIDQKLIYMKFLSNNMMTIKVYTYLAKMARLSTTSLNKCTVCAEVGPGWAESSVTRTVLTN